MLAIVQISNQYYYLGHIQKIFVMPNMDDLYLPLMSSGMDNIDMSQNFSGESQDQQECRSSEWDMDAKDIEVKMC